MAKKFDIETLRFYEKKRAAQRSRITRERYLCAIAGFQKIDLSDTPIMSGDRTENTPPLRQHSRQSMRFDKLLSTNAYLVQPGGKYWFESIAMSLAIITKAKMIMASNTDIKHNVEDDGSKRFLIP